MARQSLISTLLVLLVMMQTSLIAVRADYLFAVEVSRYQNPSSRKSNGDFCDTGRQRKRPCDNFFIFCLRDLETSSLNSSYCPLGRHVTENIPSNKDIFEFDRGENALNGLPNPLEFGGLAGDWPSGIQLLIVIYDYDGEGRTPDLVDSIAVNFTGLAGQNFTDFETYFGRFGKGQIELSFRVQCGNDSYGSDCGILCVERDDDQGHYTCDSEGNRVCRDGYQNPETNCTQCVPADGCSPLGGYCTAPGTCICREGFSGVNCSESRNIAGLGTATGFGSEIDQDTSAAAAIAGGVVGASLFMVAVVSAAIVSILLWRYRNSHSRGKGGESSVIPGDNPVCQVEKLAITAVVIPGDNPTYGEEGDSITLTGQPGTQPEADSTVKKFENPIYGTHLDFANNSTHTITFTRQPCTQLQSEADSRDATVKKFENPIYGTQWDFANNGHIYATLEPQHVHLPQDPDYAIVPDEQIYDTPPE